MAFRSARIPRFTLFSGPNCSLCDTAKAALAKVRASRPFELDIINIQDQGQERWKRKYVYWIPALHLEGKEVAKGRWDESAVIQALKEWDQTQDQQFWNADGVYVRAQEDILGDGTTETERRPGPTDQSRCFNCGEPDHKIPECPQRLDRDVIALSRQYYQFFQGTLGLGNWQRVHTVEAWRQQRLTWVEEFEPGQIKGELLKEALGPEKDELLKNISAWGYPPGWLSETDPRERVRIRIWSENNGDVDVEFDDTLFEIHGEDHVETMSFRDAFHAAQHSSDTKNTLPDKSGSRSSSPTQTESSTIDDTHFATPTLARWANYPSDYFSSQHLIPYRPPPPPPAWDRFMDTSAYLAYHAPHTFVPVSTPPPPLDEPPPLPPTPPPPPPSSPPPSSPPPLPPLFAHQSPHKNVAVNIDFDQGELSEGDMDLSDSE